MVVIFNNQKKEVQHSKIKDFLSEVGLSSSKGIAVAVNDVVIPRSGWETETIKENDRITVIRATQGG